jgi:hypothetical protein
MGITHTHTHTHRYIYIYGSNKDFEERKSSIEILTKVVLESFYKPMVLGCLQVGEVFLRILWGG